MKDLKKVLDYLEKMDHKISCDYVISQSQEDWKKFEIMSAVRKALYKSLEEQGIKRLDVMNANKKKK